MGGGGVSGDAPLPSSLLCDTTARDHARAAIAPIPGAIRHVVGSKIGVQPRCFSLGSAASSRAYRSYEQLHGSPIPDRLPQNRLGLPRVEGMVRLNSRIDPTRAPSGTHQPPSAIGMPAVVPQAMGGDPALRPSSAGILPLHQRDRGPGRAGMAFHRRGEQIAWHREAPAPPGRPHPPVLCLFFGSGDSGILADLTVLVGMAIWHFLPSTRPLPVSGASGRARGASGLRLPVHRHRMGCVHSPDPRRDTTIYALIRPTCTNSRTGEEPARDLPGTALSFPIHSHRRRLRCSEIPTTGL